MTPPCRTSSVYRYDDEVLVRKRSSWRTARSWAGPLGGTAAEVGGGPSGQTVAEDYRFGPIVRMGTIFNERGEHPLEALLEKLGDGLYVLDAKGGQTAGEDFSFGAQYGYEVRGGKKGRMVRDLNVSGNLYRTMMAVAAVGSDFDLAKAGGCGKGQTNIRSCHGAPHVLIKNLVVGGA